MSREGSKKSVHTLPIARTLRQQSGKQSQEEHDRLTGLPLTTNLPEVIARVTQVLPRERSVCLLFVDVVRLSEINASQGRSVGDQVLLEVARTAQECLGTTDMLFRHADDEFVALLGSGDVAAIAAVAKRIRDHVRAHKVTAKDGSAVGFMVSTHTLSVGSDSPSLQGLFQGSLVSAEVPRPSSASRIH